MKYNNWETRKGEIVDRMNQASQTPPCIYTVETGKHEWNTLHWTGSECGISYEYCPDCRYVNIRGAIKSAGLLKLLRVYLTNL